MIEGIVEKLCGSNFVKNANYVKFGPFSSAIINIINDDNDDDEADDIVSDYNCAFLI